MKPVTKGRKESRPKVQIDVLRAPSLAKIRWLAHGFSTRTGGFSKIYGGNALNLGFTRQDSKSAVERNRNEFLHAVTGGTANSAQSKFSLERRASRPPALVTLRQLHSDIIRYVSKIPEAPLAGDGLITDAQGIFLGILTADCLPVILVDPRHRAIGVFHAGWRGTLKRIVEKGVGEMHRQFGSRAADLRAAIGPGIRGCCYTVGAEVWDAFESQFSYANELFRETKERNEVHEKYPLLFLTARAPGHSELPRKIFLDLAKANRRQLMNAGVCAKNISDLGLCTSCRRDMFFSHRAERGITGRMMAVAGIRA